MIPTIRDPSSSIPLVHHHEHVHTPPCGIGQAPSVLESVDPRLTAQEGTPFCKWIQTAAKKVKTFFEHRFADFRMLVKAFNARGVSDETVVQRMRDVDLLVNVIGTAHLCAGSINGDLNLIKQQFLRLSPDTRQLFYNLEEYTDKGGTPEEMLRECRQVLYFQKIFSGRVFTFKPRLTPGPIPGTFKYEGHNIPAEVQEKADEINRLKAQFALLTHPPRIPDLYKDPVMLECMSFPVFDSSHPAVQNALNNGTSTTLNDRNLRHLMDKQSMESLFSGPGWVAPRCPNCRHPEVGRINRDDLFIDTGMQDEILQFLRNAVAGETPITTTTITTPTEIQEALGAVPYVQTAVPAMVQTKAALINRLKVQFNALPGRPAPPPTYVDPVSNQILAIPVFDLSHTAIQNALRDANTAGIRDRTLRHTREKDDLEAHLATGTSAATARCLQCGSGGGGIRRENLRIDTALQDEILQYLRTAVRGPETA